MGTEFYVPDKLKEISDTAEKKLAAAGIELVWTDPVFALGQEERTVGELKAEFSHRVTICLVSNEPRFSRSCALFIPI
jgi:hypothetical protein